MQFQGVRRDPVCVRPLADTPADLQIMLNWMTDERVLEYWDGRDSNYTAEKVREKFMADIGTELVPCIVEYEGAPVGYLQFYPVEGEYRERYGYAEGTRVFGLDQFIGEPAHWNRGLGTIMVAMIVDYLFEVAGADVVVLDPVVENPRAIRCYEKVGFRKVRHLPRHELHEGRWRDAWLMEIRKAQG